MFGSILCPALDAVVLMLKQKIPSMKKKGASPESVKKA
jgi:hypothetical protein